MPTWTTNIPSQVKTYANLGAFPVTGSVKTIYIAEDSNIAYYWTGSAYQPISIQDLSGLVPYTGATNDVDLGNNDLNAEGIKIKGTAGNGHLNMKHQSSNPTAGGQETVIFAGSDGEPRFKNDGNAFEQFASREWVGLQGFITNVITALGFTPVPQTRTINGLDLTTNRTLTTANINDSTNRRYVTDRGRDIANNTWRHINSSDSSPITGTTINTIIQAVHIPANTLTSNSVLRILQNEYDKTGANNTSVRIYINTSNSLVGASLLANRLNFTGLYFQLRRNLKCDGTNLKGYNNGANIAVESELLSSSTSRTPVNVSVDNWLIFAVQLSNTSDSIIQTGLDIEICSQ